IVVTALGLSRLELWPDIMGKWGDAYTYAGYGDRRGINGMMRIRDIVYEDRRGISLCSDGQHQFREHCCGAASYSWQANMRGWASVGCKGVICGTVFDSTRSRKRAWSRNASRGPTPIPSYPVGMEQKPSPCLLSLPMNHAHSESSVADDSESDVDAETQVVMPSKKRSRGMSQNESSQKKQCICTYAVCFPVFEYHSNNSNSQKDGTNPDTVIKDLQARIRVLEARQVIATQAMTDQKKRFQDLCKRRDKYAGDALKHQTRVQELEKELVVKDTEVRVKETEVHEHIEKLKSMEKRLVQIQDICQQTSSILANVAA
ncbi:hypothetical protein EV361DRAFT_874569, partial [Lentinula raphanica]